ncbi:hypothetical protein GPECTOR_5000g1294 [Gonium pectorale]|uniref:Uncharacterized protein n=1 Tax=Gonium pectorale TaxID=33097 RepID=A0A150H4K0_GONPE|nr:hypothetical protein GPECTOR_5000g1294 [Gonium pectorale]|eukprot:KXZ57067.1 hypothetical protein GPECTOR_5000g1294 [Gonium pectorale]
MSTSERERGELMDEEEAGLPEAKPETTRSLPKLEQKKLTEESAQKSHMSLRQFLPSIVTDFEELLRLHGYAFNEIEAATWVCLCIQPQLLRQRLRDAVKLLPGRVFPDKEWLEEWLCRALPLNSDPLYLETVRKFRKYEALSTLEQLLTDFNDFRRDMPNNDDRLFINGVLSVLNPGLLKLMQNRVVNNRSEEWDVGRGKSHILVVQNNFHFQLQVAIHHNWQLVVTEHVLQPRMGGATKHETRGGPASL